MEEKKIQIKVTLPGGFLHDGVTYSEGDVSTEPKDLGEYFIRAGWAEDTSGTVTHPKPDKGDVILLVQDVASPSDVTLGV
jgi:hypothetical protein